MPGSGNKSGLFQAQRTLLAGVQALPGQLQAPAVDLICLADGGGLRCVL